MATWVRFTLTALGAVAALAVSGGAAVGPPAELQPVGMFSAPIDVAAPLHEDHLLFVAERAGRVRVLRDGVLRPQPFLDITGLVRATGEGGLLSIAFEPRYWQTGRFVVSYTDHAGSIRIAEYRRSPDPELADPQSGRVVLTIPHPTYVNHYGGAIEFGPDALLYVATGDGGGAGDPDGNAQNLGSLLGKLLRIDPFGGDPYTIPVGNPFVGVPGTRPEIFAYGLRNPWRFSFDRATGDLVIGDVGQALREEIDAVQAPIAGGLNFGWDVFEGSLVYGPGSAPGAVPPVLEYPHEGPACSITGGVVVRDPALTGLAGRYVYGDWCAAPIRSAVLGWPAATDDADTGLAVPQLVSFGEDAGGCVYTVSLLGTVSRLAPAGAVAPVPCPDAPPETTITASPPPSSPAAVSFAFGASEAGSSFECRVDAGAWSACSSPAAFSLAPGAHVFEVRASDPGGTADPTPASASLTVIGQTGGAAAPPPVVVPAAPMPVPAPVPVTPTPVTTPPPAAASVAASTLGATRSGSAKADRLTGTARDDTLRGRRGDDVLEGLGGRDLLVGGAGRDTLLGGAGDDRHHARDSQRDVVDCGAGRDTATVDRKDVVRRCEIVTPSR